MKFKNLKILWNNTNSTNQCGQPWKSYSISKTNS